MTLADLAAELGYRPEAVRAVVGYLRQRFPSEPIDEDDLNPAVQQTIRETVAGIEYAVRGCPELH